MSQREVKAKIRSVARTRQVTRAMEAVSAVKMRRAQERAWLGRPYAASALRILERLAGNGDVTRHPLFVSRKVKNVLLVVLSSDRGLAGGLNGGVFRRVRSFLAERGLAKSDTRILPLGRKAVEHFTRRDFEVIRVDGMIADEPRRDDVAEAARLARESFERGDVDEVFLVYPAFVSTFVQEPRVHRLFPLSVEEIRRMTREIPVARGHHAEIVRADFASEVTAPHAFEPSAEAVLAAVIPLVTTDLVYQAALELKAAEFSARMVAMKGASDKAAELGAAITRKFNKIRQAAITREVSEITSGIEAMAS